MSAREVAINGRFHPDGAAFYDVIRQMAEELVGYAVRHGMSGYPLDLKLTATRAGSDDGPPECPTCGKRQWPAIHSCTGIPRSSLPSLSAERDDR